jgi:hypothetical protein
MQITVLPYYISLQIKSDLTTLKNKNSPSQAKESLCGHWGQGLTGGEETETGRPGWMVPSVASLI